MSAVYLAGLLLMVVLAGVDALLDKSPRSPRREWWAHINARPDLAWWAARRSKRERANVAVSMGKEA